MNLETEAAFKVAENDDTFPVIIKRKKIGNLFLGALGVNVEIIQNMKLVERRRLFRKIARENIIIRMGSLRLRNSRFLEGNLLVNLYNFSLVYIFMGQLLEDAKASCVCLDFAKYNCITSIY